MTQVLVPPTRTIAAAPKARRRGWGALPVGPRRAALVLLLIGLWQAYVSLSGVDPQLVSSPVDVAKAIGTGISSGSLVDATLATLKILVTAMAIGIGIAAVLTTLATWTALGEDLLVLLTAMLNPLPSIAVLPLAILWFGLNSTALVFVIANAVIWPIALNVSTGFRTVNPTLLAVGRNIGLSGWRLVRDVLAPAALPYAITGLKTGWAFGWRTVIAAELVDHGPGVIVLDAFTTPAPELYVVLSGQVELWNSLEAGVGDPDEVLTAGGLFGFSAMLSGAAVGPMARALGPVRVARIPAAQVTPAFSSAAGAQFLAQYIGAAANRPSGGSAYGVVDQLIVSTPVTLPGAATAQQAAAAMSAAGSRYAVVGSAAAGYGLITDAILRERVLAAGLPVSTPVSAAMIHPAPSVVTGTLAAQALLEITDRDLDCLLVLDRRGELHGLVSREDFLVSPSTAGVALREQISRTDDAAALIVLARRVPMLLADLMRRGRSAGEVTTINATVIDAITRKVLALVLAERDGLDAGEFTWLALGSNGRREPVLSSDIDAAVVFAETVDTEAAMAAYRSAFDEVEALLSRCGLSIDVHGTVPGRLLFARTRSEWRAGARQWLDAPLEHNGMMMTSLLLDARPIQGDPGPPVMAEVFGDMRSHPGTLRLLLAESLTHRARIRSMRDVLARRGGSFDLKTNALRPVADIARWAALAAGSAELSTAGRLAAAAGSEMFPTDQADTLIEVFEVLQKTRLRYQLDQVERGEQPTDVVVMHQLSPLDRSLIAQAVREIAAVQRRMTNVAQVTTPADW